MFDRDAIVRGADALLRLARASRDRPLPEVLDTVASAISEVTGFECVSVMLLRPEWDDLETVTLHAPAEVRQSLLGKVAPREPYDVLLSAASEGQRTDIFFLPADSPAWTILDGLPSYTPEATQDVYESDEWRPEDGLCVPLRDASGQLVGLLSLDVPHSGRRPTDADLDVVVSLSNHAALAIENARRAQELERQRTTLADLLDISLALSAQSSSTAVIGLLCERAVPQLGFETVSVYGAGGDLLEVRCSRRGDEGASDVPELLDMPAVASILQRIDSTGCALATSAELLGRPVPSHRNGHGPLAWHDHRLVAPIYDHGSVLLGLIVFDDPVDRLLPSVEGREALGLLSAHAGALLRSIDRRLLLERLATFDPLTGVRNRWGLHRLLDSLIAAGGGVAVVMCDLDHFKAINDNYGHDAGDRVLAAFGSLLRAQARSDDLPFRVGGEEFCLILPRVDAAGAALVADRLREATRGLADGMSPPLPGLTVTVSLGVAATAGPGSPLAGTDALLAAADRALYQAKASGRDATILAS